MKVWINNDDRVKLMGKIDELGKSFQAAAESAAMNSVRLPANKSYQEEARKYITMHDTRMEMANKVIDYVNSYWPREQKQI
jgi:hypothetical protein